MRRLTIHSFAVLIFTFVVIFSYVGPAWATTTGSNLNLLDIGTDEDEKESFVKPTKNPVRGKRADSDTDDSESDSEAPSPKPADGTKDKNPKGELYIPDYYNKLEIPKFMLPGLETIPIPVTVFISIRSISDIDEVNEQISLEMDIFVDWLDGILLHDVIIQKAMAEALDEPFVLTQRILDPSFLLKIWKPDVHIENLVSVDQPKMISKPARLKVGAQLSYSMRITVKISCEMNFQYYPADTQRCPFTLRSYSYNNSELMLVWRPPGVFLINTGDSNFDISAGSLRRFTLLTRTEEDKSTNETYDSIQFTCYARRKLSYQLLQTYIPSTLYIAITWLCFMIPSRMIEARIAIAMTTLLTLTAMFASVRESTPVVSYTKAIDIWMVVSIALIFLTLLEFAILLWTETANEGDTDTRAGGESNARAAAAGAGNGGRDRDGVEAQPFLNDRPRDDVTVDNEVAYRGKSRVPDHEPRSSGCTGTCKPTTFGRLLRNKVLHHTTITIQFVEDYACPIILSIFTMFNIVYWSWLLICSGYFQWNVEEAHNNLVVVEDGSTDLTTAIEMELDELPVFGK